jgi:hypothetical protein
MRVFDYITEVVTCIQSYQFPLNYEITVHTVGNLQFPGYNVLK